MKKKELINFFGKQITFSKLFIITIAINIIIGFGLPILTKSFAGAFAFFAIIGPTIWLGENFGLKSMKKARFVVTALILVVILSIYFRFFNRSASCFVISLYYLLFGFAAYINLLYHENDKQVNSD